MMNMMQGDAYALEFEIKGDGGAVDSSLISDIEVSLGNLNKRLKANEVVYDNKEKCYRVPLTQEETQGLGFGAILQIRVKTTSGDVIGADLGTVAVRQAVSKVVL